MQLNIHTYIIIPRGKMRDPGNEVVLTAGRLIIINCRNLLTPTNLGLHSARFGAIKLVAPSVLLLRMAVINILFIVLDKRLISTHILLVRPLMLFT